MSERLTKQKIDKFTYAGGWDVRWDSDVTGLGVRLYPTGKKIICFVLSIEDWIEAKAADRSWACRGDHG